MSGLIRKIVSEKGLFPVKILHEITVQLCQIYLGVSYSTRKVKNTFGLSALQVQVNVLIASRSSVIPSV